MFYLSNEILGQNYKYIGEGIDSGASASVPVASLYCHSLSLDMTRAEPEPSIVRTV